MASNPTVVYVSAVNVNNMAVARLLEMIGGVVEGRYRVLSPLGTGASGQVFRAEDTRLKRMVALKLMHPSLAGDKAFVRKFEAEARTIAQLSHEHIVAVHDSGLTDDYGAFLVLELLSGGSLRRVLDEVGTISISQAVSVGIQAAKGLAYAAGRGLVHRDIKPANLLFNDNEVLKIGDFGIARALAEAGSTEPNGALIGSARYASPEQAMGSRLDSKSDVYSLAVVLIEAVTGEVPFSSDNSISMLMARVNAEYVADRRLGPLGPVLELCMRRDPKQRPSALQLAERLSALSAGLPKATPLPLCDPATIDELVPEAQSDPTIHATSNPSRAVSAANTSAPSPRKGGRKSAGSSKSKALSTPDSVAIKRIDLTDAVGVAVEVDDHSPPAATASSGDDDWVVVDPEAPRLGRKLSVIWRSLLALLAIAVVIVVGLAAWKLIDYARTPSYPVPEVVGKNAFLAAANLQESGFDVEVTHIRRDGTEAGQVVDQSPKPAELLKEGYAVKLTVSDGQTLVAMPNLKGSDEEIVKSLEGAGLVGEVSHVYNEEVAAGEFVSIEPDGADIEKGSTVKVVVSDGPAPREIPEMFSWNYEQAAAELTKMGLVPVRGETYADHTEKGLVAGWSPKGEVDKGTQVTVYISLGPDLVTVPSVAGKGVSGAEAVLNASGLKVGGVSGSPSGTVVGVSPAPGASVKRGSSVTLTTN